MSETEKSAIDVIAKHLGVEREKVTADKNIIEDLGADSLDIVEIVMAMEERFNIEIDDETADKISTVGDAIEAVEKLVKAKDGD